MVSHFHNVGPDSSAMVFSRSSRVWGEFINFNFSCSVISCVYSVLDSTCPLEAFFAFIFLLFFLFVW